MTLIVIIIISLGWHGGHVECSGLDNWCGGDEGGMLLMMWHWRSQETST